MKKIFVIFPFLFFAVFIGGQQVNAGAIICEKGGPKITENSLDCIDVTSYNCNSVDILNQCGEEVYYTDLECWDDSSYDKYLEDGFRIENNEVSVSRKEYSSPIPSSKHKYYGRINYAGGIWLPCTLPNSFYDSSTKIMTIGLRKGAESYKIIATIPDGPSRIDLLSEYYYVLIIAGIILYAIILYVIHYRAKNRKQ